MAVAICCAMTNRATYSYGQTERWSRSPRSHFVQVVQETSRSVVSIQGEKQYEVGKRSFGRDAQYDVFNGMGTGVVVDERGYIITNYHVVKGLLKLEVVTSDGERYRDVELIRNDVETDLALLKIKPKAPLQKIRMGRVERIMPAEDVYAIGNPFGYNCSVSRGIVSAVDRPLEVNENLSYDRVIQTDAAINPGNSGGPLVNIDGEMIGLNAAVREEAENIAFAIPIDVVANVAEKMIRQSVAKMTHHGLKFRVVDSDSPEYPANANGEDVLVVESVDPRSPAATAGVQAGDVLLSSNGHALHSSLDFTCSLIGLSLSDVASLEVERGGQTLDASIAFSNLANHDATSIASSSRVVSTEDDARYKEAPTSDTFAQETTVNGSEKDGGAVSSASQTVKSERSARSKTAQRVWDVFGMEVETVSKEEYRSSYPQLVEIMIGDLECSPEGGVYVKAVDPKGVVASNDVKLQKGDFIFGLGVGATRDKQIGIKSVDELSYIAGHLDKYVGESGGKAKIYLIRNNRPYFLEIDLTAAK